MKKMTSLTTIFIKETYQNSNIWNKNTGKINKKSTFFWLMAILFLGISYISYSIIKLLIKASKPQLFLSCYFHMTTVFLLFQTILICANVFWFSKDVEKVLYMPIKPIELLMAKFNTLVLMLYGTEAILCLFPFTLYGLMTNSHLLYYLWEILILIVFPIIIVSTTSSATFIIMKFFKHIKNKQISQILIPLVLFSLLSLIGIVANKKIFEINPSIDILANPSNISMVMSSFAKILIYNIIMVFIFLIIASKGYINQILNNMNSLVKVKKKYKMEKKSSKKSKMIAYIVKEIKNLIQEPAFFIQCLFPTLILLIAGIIAIKTFSPTVTKIAEVFKDIMLDREILCYILIIIQVIASISNISLTAVSREGKNAVFMKYVPIDLYKQFKYKNVPQVLLNTITSIAILIMIKYIMPAIGIMQLIYIFAIAMLINLINSYLMLIVDLRRPNLNWDTPYIVVKRSDNKIFQYVFMIINVLLLMYISNILEGLVIDFILIGELIIYLFIFIIIDRCVKKWKNEIFNKIN